MNSRSETIRQVMAGMEPKEESGAPVRIAGPVAQVNIISHATLNIESLRVAPEAAGPDQGESIAELVHTLAVLESASSTRKVTPESVWRRLKGRMGLPVCGPVPPERQREAMEILLHRLALARGDMCRDPEAARRRSQCYRRCHALARRHGLYEVMRAYMQRLWEAESMRCLEDEELMSLEAYLRGYARKGQAAGQVIRSRPWPERP